MTCELPFISRSETLSAPYEKGFARFDLIAFVEKLSSWREPKSFLKFLGSLDGFTDLLRGAPHRKSQAWFVILGFYKQADIALASPRMSGWTICSSL